MQKIKKLEYAQLDNIVPEQNPPTQKKLIERKKTLAT